MVLQKDTEQGTEKKKVSQASQVRLQYATTIPGTWNHHKFVPGTTSEIKIQSICCYQMETYKPNGAL
jgi:hypothetical protein